MKDIMETKLAVPPDLAYKNYFHKTFFTKNPFDMVSVEWKKRFNQLRH